MFQLHWIYHNLFTVSRWGTHNGNSERENRYIILTNNFNLIAIGSIVLYNIPSLLFSLQSVYWMNLFILPFLASLLINKFGFHYFAKLLFCSATTLSIAVNTFFCLGKSAGFHFYFLLFAFAPILIWSFRQIAYILFFFFLNLSLFVYVNFLHHDFLNVIPLSASAIQFYQISSLLTTFITIGAIIALFQCQVTKNAKIIENHSLYLKEINEKLETQKNEIQTQNSSINIQRKEFETLNQILNQQNKEISEQRDQLIELNATKDKFFSILAHDLKNPFQVLLTLSELLTKSAQEKNDEIQEYSEMIYQASHQSYKLLENLLEWSRFQTGNIQYKPETLNLKEQIEEALSLCQELANNKRIYLSYDIQDNICLHADKHMLRSIYHNLLTNAIKFSHRDEVVHLKAMEWEDGVLFTIKDNGIGIPEERRKHLFKPGIKNNTIGTENEVGTGLGLIICKEFIEKHGGKIWVESELNQGTEFKFTLPKI